jgi:hypothetical protein
MSPVGAELAREALDLLSQEYRLANKLAPTEAASFAGSAG